jgi:hypothetical protein
LPPVAQSVNILNGGSGSLVWAANKRPEATWLSVSPTTGTATEDTPGRLTIMVDARGLAYGVHTTKISVGSSTAGVTGSPREISVRFSYQPQLQTRWLPLALNTHVQATSGDQP